MNLYYEDGTLTEEAIHFINIEARKAAFKYRYGKETIEDFQNLAWQFALSKLHLYDGKRALGPFVATVMATRFLNYKRDHYYAPVKPCKKCDGALDCKHIQNTMRRNEAKMKSYYGLGEECGAGKADSEGDVFAQLDWADALAHINSKLDRQEQIALRRYLMGRSYNAEVLERVLPIVREALAV
jgi:hypothetical protein